MNYSNTNKRITRKEKRKQRNQNIQPVPTFGYTLSEIEPLTLNQKITFDSYEANKHLMLFGTAGTGKSFLSLYLALNDILSEDSKYKKIVIVRSTVAVRDKGFLPGDDKQKNEVFEAPYSAICTELFGKSNSYEYLKKHGLVEFISTSYIRGITLNDCVVFFDECQNANFHELDSVITRAGKNCKYIISGDFTQSDFVFEKDKKGVTSFMEIIKNIKSFKFIQFNKEDIVRSGLVKEYIIEKDRLNITG